MSKSLLSPARLPGEDFATYKARRAGVAMAMENSIRARPLVHVSTQLLALPLKGADEKVEEDIRAGHAVVIYPEVTMANGNRARLARTKGVTYRKPKGQPVDN